MVTPRPSSHCAYSRVSALRETASPLRIIRAIRSRMRFIPKQLSSQARRALAACNVSLSHAAGDRCLTQSGLSGQTPSGRLAHTWCRGCATPICDNERRVAANRYCRARMGRTRGILAHWAQLGAVSSGNSRGPLKAVAVAVIDGRSRTTARRRAFHLGSRRCPDGRFVQQPQTSTPRVPGGRLGVYLCIHRERAKVRVRQHTTLPPAGG